MIKQIIITHCKEYSMQLQNRVPRVQVLLPLPKQKDTCGCLFCFVVKAERLELRNSKVLALLTVNSPVDCLRIELIIKPLQKKHRFFGAFFLYLRCFTAILLTFPI